MNHSYYHHAIPQPPRYAYAVPILPVPAPRVQVIPVHYATGEPYPRFVSFLDDVFILDIPNNSSMNQQPPRSYTQNHYIPYTISEDTFDMSEYSSLEETYMMLAMEADPAPAPAPQRSGSGLSEEEISKCLHVYTAQGNKIKQSEAVTCSICFCDCEKNEKIGRLECGHQYHAVCIKGWLLSKNVCPLCRAVALRV
ncbi:uncharacterized protein LOC143598530 [Bidens hawaiensis]|uniref:uncharacterized protein LOC143598530 n=1 Tax=Bidens hawaiensis TaxID=980011 RepID=UPI00404AF956